MGRWGDKVDEGDKQTRRIILLLTVNSQQSTVNTLNPQRPVCPMPHNHIRRV
ncbi:hypothetical protein [Nostoc linckia]|uniref:hypothetical protein n=1 Tax=Nostoc linckia TaxID=92942 RepID=UPI0015D48680|nr:hypothetical protein [Nostoc linckia]